MIDLALLNYIPSDCSYDEWTKVGMALKHEGYDLSVWDDWSSRGTKYKSGECKKKWKSFNRHDVTGGTLAYIAGTYGYMPSMEAEEYDLTHLTLEENIVDPTFVSREAIPPRPDNYNPVGDMLEYFTTMFQDDDFVGYCVRFWWSEEEKKWKPESTQYRRTAGDIIHRLRAGSIEDAIGTTNPEAGAWVRFNPLDGKGENNRNVTRWRYCLVESDEDDIEKQYSLYKAMNLPIKFLIHSGGKSLHALVKIDAENAQQYEVRVRDLYEFCKKSGLHPDENDKNSSRFSRLPGVMREGHWQYIVERDIGAASYDAWLEWRQEEADDLPADVNLDEIWDNMPALKPELIPGILREGHKLLLAGPSKAGKSFMLINLAISIAEGLDWLGMPCKQGKIVYVNLELDSASCFQRIKEIYEKRGIVPRYRKNITVLNLRGKAVPMNKLTPIAVHRYKNKGYAAIIIDPIYKVITGDENNATEMSKFCSYFDKLSTELGCAVIYCHHHSKGASGKYANAADRSSGSGVFARDPDAIIDLREVKTEGFADKYRKDNPDANKVLTGWEVSSTLREFAPAPPMRVWFDHPVHVPDVNNYLGAASYNDSGENGRGLGEHQAAKTDWFQTVEDLLMISGKDTAVSIEAVGIKYDTARKHFSKETNYEVATVGDDRVVHKRSEDTIVFGGVEYKRKYNGNRCSWFPSAE